MPSAPLFYQPLIRAQIASTKIGESTIGDAIERNANFAFLPPPEGSDQRDIKPMTKTAEQVAQSPLGEKLVATMTAIEGLQQATQGSQLLTGIKLAVDDEGWIANRVETMLDNHPDLLDSADMEGATKVALQLAEQARAELAADPGMKLSGGTLEIAPKGTVAFEKLWIGEQPLSTDEQAFMGVTLGRELQHAVTPAPADTTSTIQWVEDGTAEMLALWPGAATKVAQALGLADTPEGATALEATVNEWRNQALTATPSAQGNQSLMALLGAAGIDGSADTARDAAFQVLQGTELGGVPGSIAAALVGANKLPEEATGYIAGRIVETAGVPGNVTGLIAELDHLNQPPQPPTEPPPPVEPPPVEPPPADEPPPAEEPPPVEPPPAEEPPAEPPPTDAPAPDAPSE